MRKVEKNVLLIIFPINAKNTPVVLVMAIAAFDPGSSVASRLIYTNVQTEGKTTHKYITDV